MMAFRKVGQMTSLKSWIKTVLSQTNFHSFRCLFLVVGCAATTQHAAQIVWEAPQNIPQSNIYTEHFKTNGVSMYAYNCYGTNSVFSNPSIVFSPALTAATFTDANVTITGGGTDGSIVETTATPPFGNFDAALKGLFGTARQRYLGTKGSAYYEVTLRQLTAGRKYLIQAWVNDSRSSSPLGRTSIVKDLEGGAQSAEIFHNTNTVSALGGVGQYVTGSFVASGTNQVFRFVGEKTGTGSANYCAFISAFQVRDITQDAAITWEAPVSVANNNTQVSKLGNLLYAYTGGSGSTVNSVIFSTGLTNTLNATNMLVNGFTAMDGAAFSTTSGLFNGLSSEYKSILKGGVYGGSLAASVLLKGLTVGNKYLVQLWINDPRNDASTWSRYADVSSAGGNTVQIHYNSTHEDGSPGQYSIGTFTATLDTQLILIDGDASSQLNAIQVRDLSSIIMWDTPVTLSADTDVSKEGVLRYAHRFANTDTASVALNGVTFTAITGTSDHTNVTRIGMNTGDGNEGTKPSGLSANYQSLCERFTYVNEGAPLNGIATNVLKNLIPGRRYLIQHWANDSRTGPRVTKVRNMGGLDLTLDNNTTDEVNGSGQYIIGRFTADATTKSYEIVGLGAQLGVMNAVQVRDITATNQYWVAASGTGNWNKTGTNWDPSGDGDTVWNTTNSVWANAIFTNVTASVTLAEFIWARNIVSEGNTTIKGAQTLTVNEKVSVAPGKTLTVGDGTTQTQVTISNDISGGLTIASNSRIMLGDGASGNATASIAGNGGNYFGAIQTVDNGVAEWNGGITTVSAARIGAGINGTLIVNGKVTGSTLTLRSANSGASVGTVVLANSNNNYTGDTTIYSPVRIGCDNPIPVASKWAFTTGVVRPIVDLNGFAQEVQSFWGTLSGSAITNSHATPSRLTVNTLVDQTASSLLLSGNLSVIKSGSAKLTLGMNNTYTGATTIASGTLALSAGGDIAQSASIQIYTNATLDVTAKTGYTIQKKVIATGGSINVGTGKTLSFAPESVLQMPIPLGVPSGSSLTVTGDVDVSNMNLTLTGTENYTYGMPYIIITASNGTISNLPASVPSGYIAKPSADSKALMLYRKGTVITFSI